MESTTPVPINMSSASNKTIRWSNFWIKKWLGEQFFEEFLGDLEEIHQVRAVEKGILHANMMYLLDSIHLIIGFTSFNFKTNNNNTMVFSNMLKIAWRHALRQKQFTFLNIAGLTLGITSFILIAVYIHHESNYDVHYANKERIFRINQPDIWGDWDAISSTTGPNVATAIKEDIPDFEEVTRILTMGSRIIKTTGSEQNFDAFKENEFYAVEENFLEVFNFDLLQGDPATMFQKPLSLVLTATAAKKYFGYNDAIGQTLDVKYYDGSFRTFTVTGILADLPSQTHFNISLLTPLSSYQESMDMHGWKWIWTAFSTYGLVKEGTNIADLEEKLQKLPPKWAPPTTEKIFNQSFEEFTKGHNWTLYLQPLKDIYLSEAPSGHNFGPTANPVFVNILGLIATLILLLSSINFMNLTTAKSSKRAKEVGVRKVLGSKRSTIIYQFIFESILYTFCSTLLSLVLVQVLIAPFNVLTEKQLVLFSFLSNPLIVLALIGFVIVLGVVGGSYPALYLSSFQPIKIIKGKIASQFRGKVIRNTLVIFQFTISIALIVCSMVVDQQLKYTAQLDVGFAKDNILQIHNIEQFGFDTEQVKTKLSENISFTHIGKSFGLPPNIWSGDRYKSEGPEQTVVQLKNVRTEPDYLDLLGLEFIVGNNFNPDNKADHYKVIINESASKILGFGNSKSFNKDSPIGKRIQIASGTEDLFEVIGVVKDFNLNNLKQAIDPLIILHQNNDKVWDYGGGLSFYSMRLDPKVIQNKGDLATLLDNIKADLKSIDPAIPFEYSFMDEAFDAAFQEEQRTGKLLRIFTIIAIMIACLGLYGLSTFTAEQRLKEMSIRKVLGAKISQLTYLFGAEFAKLVGAAIVLAAPLAYFGAVYWLSDFAYKTPLGAGTFVIAGVAALGIAMVTIAVQAIKTARNNPVQSLKDE